MPIEWSTTCLPQKVPSILQNADSPPVPDRLDDRPSTKIGSLPSGLQSPLLTCLLDMGSDAVLVLQSPDTVLVANAPARALLDPAGLELAPSLAHALESLPVGSHENCTLGLHEAQPLHYRIGKTRLDAGIHVYVLTDLHPLQQARDELATSNSELKALARRLFSVQEDERRSISRDLHDDIGQSITAMRMSAHAAMEENDPARRRDDLRYLLEIADQTVGRLRDLSMLLRPPQLDALGLEAAIRWQAEVILRNTGIQSTLDIPSLGRRLPCETEQACFRIAQEALTNIVRHAGARSVSVSLQLQPQHHLDLCIHDDGRGFQPGDQQGLGLVVMRERAETAGGTLSIQSMPGAGTRIHCTLPLTPPL